MRGSICKKGEEEEEELSHLDCIPRGGRGKGKIGTEMPLTGVVTMRQNHRLYHHINVILLRSKSHTKKQGLWHENDLEMKEVVSLCLALVLGRREMRRTVAIDRLKIVGNLVSG